MFQIIKSEGELLEQMPKRNSAIKNLSKLPELDELYLSFLSGYEGMEITPDIVLYGYEEVLRENRELESASPEIACRLWLIGSSGQGDSWFLDRKEGLVLFYDHEQGDYENLDQFLKLEIPFVDFLRVGFLFAELEELLDIRDMDSDEIAQFRGAIQSIRPGLFWLFPFDYFK